MKYILFSILTIFLISPIAFAQNQSCPEYLQPVGGITNGSFTANNTLNSNGIILSNSQVDFNAGDNIKLTSGFSTRSQANFSANIENCRQSNTATTNTIQFNSFPQSVSEGSAYTVEVDYELTAPGLLHLVLADENWNKIGEVWTGNLPAGSYTESLNFTVTETPSTTINYLQVRLLNTNWEEIGVSTLQQIIPASNGNGLSNVINWLSIPQSIQSGSTYTVELEYGLQQDGLIYLLVMNESWEKIGEVWTTNLTTGNHTISLPITIDGAASEGNNYIQAQLLDLDWAAIGVDNIQETIIGSGNPASSNSLSWINLPSQVSTGSSYQVDIAYTLTEPGLIYLILMDDNWNKIGEVWSNVASGSNTESLQLEVTGNHSAGNNYLQANLFDSNWAEIGADMIAETITGGGSGINSLNWNNLNNLPTSFSMGDSYSIELDYSLNVEGLIYLQLMDANWVKIGEVWTNPLNAGAGTENLLLEITGNPSSGNNYLQAQLYSSSWESLGINAIQQTIMNSGNDNSIEFGAYSASDPSETEYHTVFPIQFNTNEYGNPNPKNKQLKDAAESNTHYAYATNWYVGDNWRGPIKAFWGPVAETGGLNFWMEWQNTQQPDANGYTNHAETDVRVQKHHYAWGSAERGYPKQISEIINNNTDVTCTANGQWAAGSAGRAHINLTVWIGSTDNVDVGERCDIIIHIWDNSGNMSANSTFNLIGQINSNGLTYDVIQRTGDYGERASFNIVPRVNNISMINRSPILADYPTASTIATNYSIDVMDFINWLRDNATPIEGNPVFDNNWYLAGMDWTITAQSAHTVGGESIPASKGRWTFNEYFIPDLN